jgi:hypothetical protein
LELERDQWTLVLWVCSAFDEHYSFRDLLAQITARLTTKRDVDMTLPPEEPAEDFIDGVLRWGPIEYELYFERSLGYLQFSTAVESAARDLLACLVGDLVWQKETGGPVA